MKIRFLNKTVEHKRFSYSPMYYDERKEQLKERRERYRKLQSGELNLDERREMLRENLRNEYSRTDYRRTQQRKSNMRILLLVAILLALGYFIFNGLDQVEPIVKKLM